MAKVGGGCCLTSSSLVGIGPDEWMPSFQKLETAVEMSLSKNSEPLDYVIPCALTCITSLKWPLNWNGLASEHEWEIRSETVVWLHRTETVTRNEKWREAELQTALNKHYSADVISVLLAMANLKSGQTTMVTFHIIDTAIILVSEQL